MLENIFQTAAYYFTISSNALRYYKHFESFNIHPILSARFLLFLILDLCLSCASCCDYVWLVVYIFPGHCSSICLFSAWTFRMTFFLQLRRYSECSCLIIYLYRTLYFADERPTTQTTYCKANKYPTLPSQSFVRNVTMGLADMESYLTYKASLIFKSMPFLIYSAAPIL